MENNQIKLTEEELNSINELRNSILGNVEMLGRLNIKKHFLQKDLAEVEMELLATLQRSEELDANEREMTNSIVAKYGEGNLNFQTGEYTPNEKQ
jgi:hypothetical protein